MYTRTSQGKQEFSSCKTIILIYDHNPLTRGQVVANPSADLIAAEDWEEYIPPVVPPAPQTEPSEYERVEALNKMLATDVVALDDESALVVKALFPTWFGMMGKEIHVGERYYYDDRLWKVLQDHTVQESWPPDIVPALFTEITLEDGSHDHPIRYNNNMELFVDLFYTQDDVLYQCTRSTGQPVYHPLSQLVGLYVKVVNE